MRGNPDDDGPQSLLPLLVASREANCADTRILDAAFLQQGYYHRSNGTPDRVERRSENSVGSLDRELKPSLPRDGDGEGIRVEIRAVEKLRRVGRDTIPVVNPLVGGDKVWGDDSIALRFTYKEDDK